MGLRTTLAASALLLVAAAATGACRRPRVAADGVVMAIESPVTRVDPRYAATSWEHRVSQLVAPGLVGLRERGLGTTAGLAETVVAEDPLTYVATLREDARFPDGRAVEAEDVRYTFASVLDPELGSPYRGALAEVIEAVEAIDARTVRFRLKRPRAAFHSDLEFGIVDARRAETVDRGVRDARRRGAPAPVDPAREPTGAGPYRLAALEGDTVILERNPHASSPPASARLTLHAIRDDNARVLALLGGSVDLLLNGVTPQVTQSLEARPRLHVQYGPSATVTYLGFNCEDPILRDPRVRRAIAMALDRPRLLASKFRGRGRIARSFLDQDSAWFAADARQWPYDPAAARRLLDEAGLHDPDGDGPLPRFSLAWKTSAVKFRVGLAQVMARQLAEIGVRTEVRPFDLATVLADINQGNFQLFTLMMTDVVEPDLLRAVFHSARIPDRERGTTGLNRFRYRNPTLDAWLDAAAAEADVAKRRAIYQDAQRLLAEDLPALPLWHEDNVLIAERALVGATLLKTGRLEGLLGAVRDGAPPATGGPPPR